MGAVLRGRDADLGRDLAIKVRRHWQKDPELAGICDQDALANLPADEQKPFTQL